MLLNGLTIEWSSCLGHIRPFRARSTAVFFFEGALTDVCTLSVSDRDVCTTSKAVTILLLLHNQPLSYQDLSYRTL